MTNLILCNESEEVETLKTRTHKHKYKFYVCAQTDRIGILSEALETTINGKEPKLVYGSKPKSYYFGFANFPQAEKFEEFCKMKFPALDAYSGHCVSRLSQRLTAHPVEVKIRALDAIADELDQFFKDCLAKALAPKVVEIDPVAKYEALKRKVARL